MYIIICRQTERKTDKDGGLVGVSRSRRELALQGS